MTKTALRSASYQAGPGMWTRVGYRLFDAEGELVEESQEGDSLPLLLGYGQAPPKLEAALAGANVGEVRRITLRAREAFGARDPNLVVEFARDEFPPELAVGDELEAEDASGQIVPLKIVDLDEERVVADTNHPLAGQSVTLELRVAEVRPASAQEIAQAAERLEQAVQQPQGRSIAMDSASALLPVAALLRHLPQGGKSGRSSAETGRVQPDASATLPGGKDSDQPGSKKPGNGTRTGNRGTPS